MHRRHLYRLAAAAILFVCSAVPLRSEPLSLILPTANDALLHGDDPSFYQYTDRTFEGRRSQPWQGGQYGFVRNPRRTSAGLVYTRFHEGVDIRAVHRDRYGEPVDTVLAIDDGYVVYVNQNERHSSYGKYVVVEHWWSGSPFYSLYAHLNSVDVRAGHRISQGDRIGMLGYTGRGLDRRRAHLHFEINMLLNRNFEHWYGANYRSSNHHDVFNGINLAGIDVAGLYLALQDDPELTIKEFLARQVPFYTVAMPNDGALDLSARYEWLVDWSPLRASGERARSWEVSFTTSGTPVRIEPSAREVRSPVLVAVKPASVPYSFLTNGRVAGRGGSYSLSRAGERYANLLALQGERLDVVDFERPRFRQVEQSEPRLRTW